jgi:phosphoketolase
MNMLMKTRKPKLTDKPLSPDLLRKMDAYWRAANYLSVEQICLYDNPLLKKPLTLEHVKPQPCWSREPPSLESPCSCARCWAIPAIAR